MFKLETFHVTHVGEELYL